MNRSDLSDILLGVIFVLALLAIIVGASVMITKWSSPRIAEIRRETYQEGATHTDGTILDLRRLQIEYATASTSEHQTAIRNLALHSASDLDRSYIQERDPELLAWLVSIGY